MELCSCWLHPLIDDFHLPLGQRYINILHSCLPSPSVVTAAHQQSEASSVAAATAASSRFLGASQLPREHPGICGILCVCLPIARRVFAQPSTSRAAQLVRLLLLQLQLVPPFHSSTNPFSIRYTCEHKRSVGPLQFMSAPYLVVVPLCPCLCF